MLSRLDGATGIKTGFTKKAGRCLVSSVCKNGREVICVVLNSPDMWERSKSLLNSAFTEYETYKILSKEDFFSVKYKTSNNKSVNFLLQDDFYYPVKKGEEKQFIYKM